jgi:uncharacterized protein
MTEPLLALGLLVFGMDSLAYDEFERRSPYRHGVTERHGVRPAGQYLGPGVETITLSGRLVPEIAGRYSSIERLREMAASGELWPMVLGTGDVLGDYRIMNIDERWGDILGGGVPRLIDFGLDLERADG